MFKIKQKMAQEEVKGGLDSLSDSDESTNIESQENNSGDENNESGDNGGKGLEDPNTSKKEVKIDYNKYENDTYGVSGDELKSLIEKGREYSESNSRIVKDEAKFAVLDLLDKGLDFGTIDLIRRTESKDISDIDRIVLSKRLNGSELSESEIREIIEDEYRLVKDEDGNYDTTDSETKIGLLKLKEKAQESDKLIKEYKEKLNKEPEDLKQKRHDEITEKVKSWEGKLPEIVKTSSKLTFGTKVGDSEFSYQIPEEEQKDLSDSANQIIQTWADNGIEGTPEQVKEIIQSNYLYQNREKIFSAIAQSVSSHKEKEHHEEIHNPDGLLKDTKSEKEVKGGLDLL